MAQSWNKTKHLYLFLLGAQQLVARLGTTERRKIRNFPNFCISLNRKFFFQMERAKRKNRNTKTKKENFMQLLRYPVWGTHLLSITSIQAWATTSRGSREDTVGWSCIHGSKCRRLLFYITSNCTMHTNPRMERSRHWTQWWLAWTYNLGAN